MLNPSNRFIRVTCSWCTILALILVQTINGNAQDKGTLDSTQIRSENSLFYLRGGITMLFAVYSDYGLSSIIPGFTFSPGLRVFRNDISAVTISAPITLGGIRGYGYGVDLPIMADLHLGSTAVDNSSYRIGAIIGVGKALFLSENFYDSSQPVKIWGVRYQAGLSVGKRNVSDRTVIMVHYEQNNANSYVFGISIQGIL